MDNTTNKKLQTETSPAADAEQGTMLAAVKRALKDREFIPYFQPQYNFVKHEMFGVEVLARWKTADNTIVPPYKFIPVMEETGLIADLDFMILEKAVVLIQEWKKRFPVLPHFSFNLSRFTALDPDLVDRLVTIIDRYEIGHDLIHFEITESAYIENYNAILSAISHLQEHGFIVEMDDFGTGFSSLSFLRDATVDVLKMDMSFLQMNANRGKGGSIISAITRMVAHLDMGLIAEGVETLEQAEFLKSVGCYLMQGYYFAKPLPEKEFYDRLLNETVEAEKEEEFHDVENALDFLDDTTQNALLFNSFVGGACLFEYDGQKEWSIIRVNDRCYTEFGIEQSDLPVDKLMNIKFIDQENKDLFKEAFDTAIATGKEAEADVSFRPEVFGQQVWAHVRVRCLAKKGNQYILYVCLENITIRKQLDEKNRLLQEELSAIVNNVPGGFASFRITDGGMECILVTHSFAALTGYTVEEMTQLLNQGITSLVYPEDLEVVGTALQMALHGGTNQMMFRAVKKDGSIIWLGNQYSLTAGLDGTYLYLYCWDATNEVNMKGELASSNNMLRDVISETETAVVITDLETHEILFANDKAAAIGKTTVKEAVGQKCYECLNKCSYINEACLNPIPQEGIEILEERYGKRYKVRRQIVDWEGVKAGICYISDKAEEEEEGPSRASESIVAQPQAISDAEISKDTLFKKLWQKTGDTKQGWSNIIRVLLGRNKEYAELLTDELTRKRIQFIAVYAILGVVSAFMTVLNYFTGWHELGIITGVFALLMLLNILLSLISEKTEKFSFRLFAAEFIAMFTAFAVVGEPEGFSILWTVMLPTCGMLLYQMKYGTLISMIQLLILVFLFWTPWGRSLLQYEYTDSFLQRFPVLYVSLYFLGLFFEFIRHTTQEELTLARERFEYMYIHDALTGLYNRYGFNSSFQAMFEHTKKRDYGFAISDLDSFKQINDKYGHMNGDVVLKTTANLIREVVGDHGFVSRWGGEEFSILFFKKEEAYEICRTINQKCGQITYPFNAEGVHVTISIGLVLVENGTKESTSEVITAADSNLYHAKTHGKNQITQSTMKF